MAVKEWKKNKFFEVGEIRRPTTDEGTGLHFKCTTQGTSGGSEPEWPNSIGDTVPEDGTCAWIAISATYSDLTLSNPSAIIELFQVRLSAELHGSNDIYYFHAGINDFGDSDIVFCPIRHTLAFLSKQRVSSTRTLERCLDQRLPSAIWAVA